MKKRSEWLRLIIMVALMSLSGCTPSEWWANLTRQVPLISATGAADRAIASMSMVSPGVPEVVQPPSVVYQRLMTWGNAQQVYGPNMPQIASVTVDQLVWVVELRGEWLVGMEAPGVETKLATYHQGLVVIDAHSGASIVQSLRP
jgi:hypothetical protein